jgi:hypothetical protein
MAVLKQGPAQQVDPQAPCPLALSTMVCARRRASRGKYGEKRHCTTQAGSSRTTQQLTASNHDHLLNQIFSKSG